MPITMLDGILIGVTLFSAVLAMVRGFSREVLSVASWIAAVVAAYYFYPLLTPYLSDYIANVTVATVTSAGIIFLVALIVVSVLTMRLADLVIDSRIGALDRTLGFLFGAARGILLVAVAMLFFNWLVAGPQQPVWITDAKSKPLLDSIGIQLVDLLPEDADATLIDRFRDLGDRGAVSDEEAASRGTDG